MFGGTEGDRPLRAPEEGRCDGHVRRGHPRSAGGHDRRSGDGGRLRAVRRRRHPGTAWLAGLDDRYADSWAGSTTRRGPAASCHLTRRSSTSTRSPSSVGSRWRPPATPPHPGPDQRLRQRRGPTARRCVGRRHAERRGSERGDAMFQVRVHGRGGQGVVTTAELLSVAAFSEGRHAQAFPTFGSERTGAPVVGFCRIDDRPIRTHEPVVGPDARDHPGRDAAAPGRRVRRTCAPDGYLLINTSRSLDRPRPGRVRPTVRPDRVMTVPATELAHDAPGPAAARRRTAGGFRRAHRSGPARVGPARPSRSDSPGTLPPATSPRPSAAYELVRPQIEEPARAQAD